MQVRSIDPEEARSLAGPADLALVGELALLLADGDGLDSTDVALRRLAGATAADDCELFLAHPDGSEVFLVSHQGADPEPFLQRDRFRAGEGFPGIVLRTARPLWTASLEGETDFLRTRVKARGYRSAVCVPLLGRRGASGSILLFWKENRDDLEAMARLATLASRPFATSLELSRARLRFTASSRGPGDGHSVADQLGAALPGGSVEVLVADSAGGIGAGGACPCLDRSTAELQILGGRSGWPRRCLEAGCMSGARYCLPLLSGDRVGGVATVSFRERPTPLTRYLPVALWMTSGREGAPESGAVSPGSLSRHPTAERRNEHLQVRCLGRFEVLVAGAPVLPGAFARAKARELLALLVGAYGRPLGADDLSTALWPGVDPERSRNRFHVTLSALRSVISPPSGSAPAHLRRDGRRYRLDPCASPIHVDLWRFRDLLRRASVAIGQGRRGSAVTGLLSEALALVEGDPFGGEFDEAWSRPLTHQVREGARWAAEQLAVLQPSATGPTAAPGSPVPGAGSWWTGGGP